MYFNAKHVKHVFIMVDKYVFINELIGFGTHSLNCLLPFQ